MNKTINIHLAHTLFALDEKAYSILKQYLESLETIFKNTEGGKDILEDIEMRISELFMEMEKDERYVYSEEDVRRVIEILGSPEDLAEEDEHEKKSNNATAKKLFRDPDDRFIGGVAGGLSHYLNIESLWLRLILLFLFFSSVGGVVLVYILLWILVPEAKTTTDKLKMKGERINVTNIKKKIKEELNQVGDNVKNADYDSFGQQLKKKSKNFSDFLLSLTIAIGKILALIIGIALILISSITLLGLFISTVVGGVFSAMVIPHEIFQFGIITDLPFAVIGFTVLIIVGIPFILIFTLGLRLLAQNKPIMSRMTRLILLGLWLTSLIILILFGLYESRSFAVTAKNSKVMNWNHKMSDTLRLYLNSDQKFSERVTVFDQITVVEDEQGESYRLDKNIRLTIESSQSESIDLTIEKIAKGWRQIEAKNIAESIQYNVDYYDSKLLLDNHWIAPIKSKNKPRKIRLTLAIPEGKFVYIDSDFKAYLSSKIANDQNFYRKNIAGHLWKMSKGELICQDCEGTQGDISFDEENFKMRISD
ncbi:MAG: PspC domain-containing protein, partial [Flavobacteriaceae bacterium]